MGRLAGLLWQNRGNNVNADKGFFEFIKEAIIIFLIINDKNSDECEKLISIPLMSSKEEVEEQLRIVKNFIGNTSTFNIVWLKEVFNAIHLLHSMNCESDGYIREAMAFTRSIFYRLRNHFRLYILPDCEFHFR